jgi:HSP20 family protein
MSTLMHRDSHGSLADLFDRLEAPLTMLRPFAGSNPLRVEDYVRDGCYVLRAELPGVDPEKDIDVTLSMGVLTIKADKREETEGKHHSEFRYGTFARSVSLPAGTDDRHVEAVYDNGVLEVTVALKNNEETEKLQRRIPVMLNRHIDPT